MLARASGIRWQENTIKLIDFGFACRMQAGALQQSFCGTPAYASPELLTCTPFSGPEADVWAAGVVLFAMLCGRFPFRNAKEAVAAALQPPPAAAVSRACAHLLALLLAKRPEARPSMSQALEHAWFGELGDGGGGETAPCAQRALLDLALPENDDSTKDNGSPKAPDVARTHSSSLPCCAARTPPRKKSRV